MTEKNYPEEIYTEKMDPSGVWTCRMPDTTDVEKAYDLGLAHGKEQSAPVDPLAGFSNLTQAIQDGARIDWERLDGRVAKCIHPELGTLTHKMVRNHMWQSQYFSAWAAGARVWGHAFRDSWDGNYGWQLLIEGDIPVKLRTADELKPGSVFIGNSPKSTASQMFVVAHHSNHGDPDLVAYRVDNPVTSWQWAECVEVIEVKSGGFTSPKEEA